MLLEVIQFDEFQRRNVRCLEHNRRGHSRQQCFLPTFDTQAPPISGLEPWESHGRLGGEQVIPARFAEFQKVLGHLCTDKVQSQIARAGVAAAVSIETGERFRRTGYQIFPQHVLGGGHQSFLRRGEQIELGLSCFVDANVVLHRSVSQIVIQPARLRELPEIGQKFTLKQLAAAKGSW
jgi:hypothetical protein